LKFEEMKLNSSWIYMNSISYRC